MGATGLTTILSTVLIAAPVAFLAGWILAKAVFRSGHSAPSDSDHRRLLRQQQQAITERDGQVAELRAQLEAAEKRLLRTKQVFGAWRDRIRPIARQFRQQRAIITELRDELRRRDTQQREAAPDQREAVAGDTAKREASLRKTGKRAAAPVD